MTRRLLLQLLWCFWVVLGLAVLSVAVWEYFRMPQNQWGWHALVGIGDIAIASWWWGGWR